MHKIIQKFGLPSYMVFTHDVEKDIVIVRDNCVFDEKGESRLVVIDPVSSQDFMYNENGFPKNDIALFEEVQSDSVARTVLERIHVLHPENMPQGMTPSQMLKTLAPANFSTPAEWMKLQKAFAEDWYNTMKVNLQREQKDFKFKEPKIEPQVVNNVNPE